MDMFRGYVAAVVAPLLALGFLTSYASAKGTNNTDVIIQLRLAGDVEALPPIRSLPNSSRHDYSRRVGRCSWVKPIAPCTDGRSRRPCRPPRRRGCWRRLGSRRAG